jgi:hypothetical protein
VLLDTINKPNFVNSSSCSSQLSGLENTAVRLMVAIGKP